MIRNILEYFIKREYLIYILFCVATIITLLLTLLPPSSFEGQKVFQYDKLGHFLIFFGWTFLFGLSWIIRKRKGVQLIFIFVVGALFGISIEFAQELLPYNRTLSYYDMIADIIGSFTAVLFLWFIQNRYLKKIDAYPGK